MTTEPNRGERIPLAYIMPYVEARVLAWYGGAGSDLASERPYVTPDAIRADHPEWKSSAEAVPVLLLAEKAGVSPSTLGGWLRDWQKGRAEGRTIGFYDVDGLVVALGDTGLWSRDPNLRAAREAAEADEADVPVCEDCDWEYFDGETCSCAERSCMLPETTERDS